MTCGDTELGGWLTVTPCPPAAPLRQVTCPDGRSACPDGATCCQLPSAQYGCCPLQNVSVSPCPHTAPRGGGGLSPAVLSPAAVPPRRPCAAATGSTAVPKAPPATWSAPCAPRCRTRRGRRHAVRLGWDWDPPGAILGAQGTLAVTIRLSPVGDVKCDDQMSCPDGNTCCRLSSGAWGCCPLEEAVCCPDHVHCCPQGYTCDPQGGTCLQGGVRLPWLSKTPARGRAGDVKCDDETSCPDGNTCCRLSSGAWGCCPLEQAVCCPDHVHCCPQGYTCDPQGGTCLKGGVRLPWLSKTPARGRGGDVKCDDQMSCPDGNTCCQLSSGAWGCCPLEQAVCCKDHQHCCPRGYTCNAATQSCEKLLAATPLRFPVPTGPPLSPPRPVATIPADTARACPPGQRCCRSKDGSWARCPFAQGSCCEDGRRCCPAGYRCARGGRECWPQRWDVGGGISSRTLLPSAAAPPSSARGSCGRPRRRPPRPLRPPRPRGCWGSLGGARWRCCGCCRRRRRCPRPPAGPGGRPAAGPGRCPRARGGRGGAGRGAGPPGHLPAGRCRSGGRGTRARPATRTRRAAPAASARPEPAAPR
uniref:Granulin precursor n=1 Tax=Anas platyrhynchos TaxID=8839 RepID=A0A8B9T798_ANAPL